MYEAFGMLAIPDAERIKLMKNVILKDVLELHKRTHTTSNLRFVVAGNLKGRMTQIEDMLLKIKLPKGRGRIELPEEVPMRVAAPIYQHKQNVDNVYFDITTFQKKVFSDQDWPAASVANTILTETFNSKIFGEARERGLAYNMGSGFGQYKTYADWGIGGQAQQENLPDLADIIVREMKKLLGGKLTDEDIEAAKQYGLGSFQRGAQTVDSVVGGYSNRYFFEERISDYFGFPERLAKVTKNKVVEVMRGMFEEGIWGLGMLGTADEELQNKIYEKVSVLWRS
jgi:predicted Zn-dependent peptidase